MDEIIVRFIGVLCVTVFELYVLYHFLNGLRIHFFSRLRNHQFKKSYGEWAVVTGCTDGIGLEYSKELAARGMNIVLVSRFMKKLDDVAREIEHEFQVQVHKIQADFSKNGPELYNFIAEQLKGLDIGILVNNVGVINPYPMLTEEMIDCMIWDHIHCNMASMTFMTKIVLPDMKKKRRGAIVNLASIAGLSPLANFNVYAATKIYVEFVSRGLELECKGTGITVQTLTPGYVNTKMVRYSSILSSGGLLVPSAKTYARNAVSTLGYTNFTTGYWPHGVQAWFSSLIPAWLYMDITTSTTTFFKTEYEKNQTRTKNE